MVKKLLIHLRHPDAKAPTKGSPYAAGHDLYSCEDVVINAGGRRLVNIGISAFFPFGTYGRIASRSGLSLTNGLEVGAGVIDFDYGGIIKVLLYNHSEADYKVAIGDRIAQLIIVKIEYCDIDVKLLEVDFRKDLVRGDKGFGSTGV
jgi:dUTP pyrophosphatase